jgi:hypothetical protein
MENPGERKKVFVTPIDIQLPRVCQTLFLRGTDPMITPVASPSP